tara:strand:- start:83 stop:994 length:912 start_codon:yes stop_codon:yes gene_type:complete
MQSNILGRTDLRVSRLGFGTSEIGLNLALEDKKNISAIFSYALDNGINFIDTAASYGISEQIIGESISHRRSEFILASKTGHSVLGKDWTYDNIIQSVDKSLRLLKTDYIDIMQLHGTDVTSLEKGDVIRALQDSKAEGKIRFIGYSGGNQDAYWAITSGLFDTIQTSFNIVDQYAKNQFFHEIKKRNIGLIIKRPIANAVWGKNKNSIIYSHIPDYTDEYFQRSRKMKKLISKINYPEDDIFLALKFTLSFEQVQTAIVGTQNIFHLRNNIKIMESKLTISDQVIDELCRIWSDISDEWEQK